MWKVHVSSSRSMLVTPGTLRACWMLAPWVPMARPIRSSRTANCSWNRDANCLELCRKRGRQKKTWASTYSLPQQSRQEATANIYLQLPVCLFVPQHERQLGAEAPEVHVIHHVGPLCCDLIHRLKQQSKLHSHKESDFAKWYQQNDVTLGQAMHSQTALMEHFIDSSVHNTFRVRKTSFLIFWR